MRAVIERLDGLPRYARAGDAIVEVEMDRRIDGGLSVGLAHRRRAGRLGRRDILGIPEGETFHRARQRPGLQLDVIGPAVGVDDQIGSVNSGRDSHGGLRGSRADAHSTALRTGLNPDLVLLRNHHPAHAVADRRRRNLLVAGEHDLGDMTRPAANGRLLILLVSIEDLEAALHRLVALVAVGPTQGRRHTLSGSGGTLIGGCVTAAKFARTNGGAGCCLPPQPVAKSRMIDGANLRNA